jgi:ParB family transcriptional regulator, chromosome partitioning protein
MSKMDELRRSVGSNVDESMGGGRTPRISIPGVSVATPSSKPTKLQGVDRSKDAADIEVDRIVPDPDQPREEFNQASLTRLADSMARHSQISPIMVRWDDSAGKYIIVAGERRWRAAIQAGIPKLKCLIRDGDFEPGELLAMQVIENACREDLQPIEQAKAFRSLMNTHGWSQHRLADELGIAQPSVVRALSLLTLPPVVAEMVEKGDLSQATAYEISKADDIQQQSEIAARVVSERLTRDETVEVVKQARGRDPQARAGGAKSKAKGKPAKLPTELIIKTSAGIKIVASARKGFDLPTLLAMLEEATEKVRAEIDPSGEQPA